MDCISGKFRLRIAIGALLAMVLLFSSCISASRGSVAPDKESMLDPAEQAANEAQAAAVAAEAAATAARIKKENAAAFVRNFMSNDSGKTIVSKVNRDIKYRTSYMLVSKAGTVLIADPYQIIKGIDADIIISTHADEDHNDQVLYSETRARKSLYSLESFTVKDVKVTGIAGSHYGDDFDPLKPSNVIYLIEMDGLRIAFMGDICQTKLTDAQLAALGAVDIAFIIMENAPDYGYSAERSLAMLRQISPRLAFPIHPTSMTVKAIGDALGGMSTVEYRYGIDPALFGPGATKILKLGSLPSSP